MNVDYNEFVNRSSRLTSDINLFKNSNFVGFVNPDTVYDCFNEYRQKAIEKSNIISWDYIVLYAVFEYENKHQNIISANFLTLDIPYGVYTDTIKNTMKTHRFFFIRGRKEYCYE